MAKQALLDVLEQTIGKYVRNLDAQSLNVAVWSGKIELHSLELDCDAVNAELDRQAAEAPNLAIPFRVVSGTFGNFQVNVPWSHLMSEPVVCTASGLKVAVEPHDRAASADFLYMAHESESVRARKVQQQRTKSLQLADDYRKQANKLKELAEQDLESSNPASNNTNVKGNQQSFAARLVRRIIENIQVEITDVNISVQGSDSCAGVILRSLSLVTTDQHGNRTFVDRSKGPDKSFLYKALQITGLGIYLDEDEGKPNFHLASITETDEEDSGVQHSYVLEPLSFDASFRQADSNKCIGFAKYELTSELSSLSVMLSRTQLELGHRIAEQIRPAVDVARPLFPEYRPLSRVTADTAVDWWKYAVRCLGRLNGRRSWVEFFRAFQLRKKYIPLYKRNAHCETCSWIQALTEPELKELQNIEADRSISVEGIMAWRNVAEAQAKKEQEKHDAKNPKTKGSIFKTLFGSAQQQEESEKAEDPPITLSVEEMRELESVTMEQVAETELTSDSQLCDVKFVLGAFRIDLTSFGQRPLSSLEMGAVSTSFNAKQDGAYGFKFAMTSLEVQDRITPKTLFPTILKNHPPSDGASSDVFQVRLARTRTGDQDLQVKLNTFEAIASPSLLRELKQFFSLSSQRLSPPQTAKVNPLLAQSLSGSVDLFYDAAEAPKESLDTAQSHIAPLSSTAPAMDDISNALIDAWKTKTETKSSWAIDFDIQAPIVVVPENCTDLRANVVVFDLGHMRLQYGILDVAPKVEEWFKSNPRVEGTVADPVLDKAYLRITSLTFMVGKNNYVKRLVHKHEALGAPNDDEAVIEPISLTLDFGVESGKDDEVPRVCTVGVLPSIAFRVSASQLTRMLAVSRSWQKTLQEMFSGEEDDDESCTKDDVSLASTSSFQDKILGASRFIDRASIFATARQEMETPIARYFVDLRLQKLSVKILDNVGNSLEVHLVYVSVSASMLSDGSSRADLSMGWFWILDRIENDFVRKQRLFAHSKLPLSADELAKEDKYDVLGELDRQGAFEEDFGGSSDLADITFKQSSTGTSLGKSGPIAEEELMDEEYDATSILDARFTGLYINWNPRGVIAMLSLLETFFKSITTNADSRADGMIITSPSQLTPRRRTLSYDSHPSKSKKKAVQAGTMLVKAEMEGLHISLNSARDDLPLFLGSMASTRMSLVSREEYMLLSLNLGELKLASPDMGQTDPMYRTILGLASGNADSLLSVRYCTGSNAMDSFSASEGKDLSSCEAYGEIELSPMRLVYIQAQVLALVEYATAGILGAMTAQAASSAANAAAELTTSSGSKKIFSVKASGFDLILPQAANKQKLISSHLGALEVEYVSMPDSGGEVEASLSDVMMNDTDGNPLFNDPVRMDIRVSLTPHGQGTKDDQAMRVDLEISTVHFLLAKSQYAQILATLDENIGEEDLCLRDDLDTSNDSVAGILGTDAQFEDNGVFGNLTHGGVELVDDPRRIYLNVKISALSLTLCGIDSDDPLVHLSALDAGVDFRKFPDTEMMTVDVLLRDLVCDDQRFKSIGRKYRSLVYQSVQNEEEEDRTRNLFSVAYKSEGDESSSIDLVIGSPRIVFIPDAISEVLDFFSVEGKSQQAHISASVRTENNREVVAVNASESQSAIETTFELARPTSRLSLTMKTSQCSVQLVDLGSDSLPVRQKGSSRYSLSAGSVAETIVLGGIFEAKMSLEKDLESGDVSGFDTEFHGDNIEAYTAFGLDLHSAVQILDPTQLSLYVNSKEVAGKGKHMDLRCAVVSPIDITLSMRNVALLNAITTSASDCFGSDDTEKDSDLKEISEEDANRVEKLAHALEADAIDESVHSQGTSKPSDDVSIAASEHGSRVDTNNNELFVKITTPEVKVTMVNDLQGLDEALLRLTIRNLVANGRVQEGLQASAGAPMFTAFDINFHTSILADYFDASTNRWKVLLLTPWELSSNAKRVSSSRRFQSNRPSTTIDVESLPCHLSFSEQFLMSLASASRMWSIYSAASSSALESLDKGLRGSMDKDSQKSKQLRKSIAASAARTFISSLPYALENQTGLDIELVVNNEREERRICLNGSFEYFRFEPPTGKGSGGQRLYGQDVSFKKTVRVIIGDSFVDLPHLDSQLGRPKVSHRLKNGRVVVSHIKKEGKTVVVYVSSGVDVHNRSSVPFTISVFKDEKAHEVGTCRGLDVPSSGFSDRKRSLSSKNGMLSKPSQKFGIPIELVETFRSDWVEKREAKLSLVFSPEIEVADGWDLSGGTKLSVSESVFSGSSGIVTTRFDITCRPISHQGVPRENAPRDLQSFVVQVLVSMTLVDGKEPCVDIFLEPRAVITNRLPLGVSLKTPMPHTFSALPTHSTNDETTHDIAPNACVEVFTPGPSLAIMARCTDMPVGGTATGWIDGGWIDLPLMPEFRMQEPLECMFPFIRKSGDPLALSGAKGSVFFIAEGSAVLEDLSRKRKRLDGVDENPPSQETVAVELAAPLSGNEDWRNFYLTVTNYAVDHTGDILFEQLVPGGTNFHRTLSGTDGTMKSISTQVSPPLGAFSTGRHRGRISLLPESTVPIRLLYLTMEGEEGIKRSLPFQIEDVSICDGGVDAMPLKWEDGSPSGFFAYRQLVTPFQSEVHVVPEYVVFNGSKKHRVCVRQPGGCDMFIEPGAIAPLRTQSQETAVITIEYPELEGQTRPLRIDSLGLRMAVVKSREGHSVGSFAVQTVVGARDSRLVVKLGDINFGSLQAPGRDAMNPYDVFKDDFLRFRIKWSELKMTLNEARPMTEEDRAFLESAADHLQAKSAQSEESNLSEFRLSTRKSKSDPKTWVTDADQRKELVASHDSQVGSDPICTILFHRFTVDWQRVFKEEDPTKQKSDRAALESPERAQLSVVIHNILIRDETPDSPYPIVFDSTSQKTSFFDLCIRFKGDPSSDLVRIDLVDLNLAHANGVSEKICLSTTEDFIWKVLDLANRIIAAAAEFAGVAIELTWDDAQDGFVVAIKEKTSSYIEDEAKYTPPKSDKMYNIKKTRVSPFKMVVSFKRNPQTSRYKVIRGTKGANIMNYFTRRLKFKIDKAELSFSRYEVSDVKGPYDRIIELLSTVYFSRMKMKMVTIMTAASFQDWKFLTARDGGDDEFVEGDILRATGNIAGNTVGYVLKRAGRGLGTGVSTVASTLGGGIETASGAIGAQGLGAGVNSLVTGVGEGVGDTLSGVGSGAGQVLKGAGQGVGQVFGGLSGGALLVGKGIGKGVTTGDGRAAASGIAQGAVSIGTGVGQGVETVVLGVGEGALSVGQGLFSGVKNVGRGIGDAFKGKKSSRKPGSKR